MRILTTILMLCLPMAAMGETYICEPQAHSILYDKVADITGSPSSFAIDLDKGFRFVFSPNLNIDTFYKGTCQVESIVGKKAITCSHKAESRLEYFEYVLLDIETGFYTHSAHGVEDVESWFGKCTEI